MIIIPKFKNYICTTSCPSGCRENIKEYISYIREIYKKEKNYKKNALIIGSSTGYGLITRLILSFGLKCNTIGLFKEKKPSEKKTATPGWYNTAFLEQEAKKIELYTKSFNNDTFDFKVKNKLAKIIKNDLKKIDILIYSIAASKRNDGVLKKTYASSIKPIKKTIRSKNLNILNKSIIDIKIKKAKKKEIINTIKVMGGEDWELWVDTLIKNNLLGDNFKTIAYSYDGSDVTHSIYKNGTIGIAKKHLIKTASKINKKINKKNGQAFIANNEAIITQSSIIIPTVPLYIAILNSIKKKKYNRENHIDQIKNLFLIVGGKKPPTIIKLNHFETSSDVQMELNLIWYIINTKNSHKFIDIVNFKKQVLKINGFFSKKQYMARTHLVKIESIE